MLLLRKYLLTSFFNSQEIKRSGSSTSSLMRHLQRKHPSKISEKSTELIGPMDSFLKSEVGYLLFISKLHNIYNLFF
jgi:hypothetical protein